LEKNSGFATLSDIPGLGFEPNLKAISKYLVAH
jgi:L-alanine-DL-glutamate epimerase-like enolase superfamily enzyme